MSVADKITQLVSDISASYQKIESKGGSVPTDKNTNNLPDAIDSIPSGASLPEKGLVFENYDSDGYPTTARFIGEWSGVFPACTGVFGNGNYMKKIKTLTIPEGITSIGTSGLHGASALTELFLPSTLQEIGYYSFYGCTGLTKIVIPKAFNKFNSNQQFYACSKLEEVIFEGHCPQITNGCFAGCKKIMLYDFSHCISIPPLYSLTSLTHALGCVIKVPQSLVLDWKISTNWLDLTYLIWRFSCTSVSDLPTASEEYIDIEAEIESDIYKCVETSTGIYEWQLQEVQE